MPTVACVSKFSRDAQWLRGAVSATGSSGQQQAAAGSSRQQQARPVSTWTWPWQSIVILWWGATRGRREVVRCQLHQRRHQLQLADTFQQLIRNSHFAFGEGRGGRKRQRQRQRQEEVTRHGVS